MQLKILLSIPSIIMCKKANKIYMDLFYRHANIHAKMIKHTVSKITQNNFDAFFLCNYFLSKSINNCGIRNTFRNNLQMRLYFIGHDANTAIGN